MASLSKDRDRNGKLNGCRTIQFVNAGGKRRSVRLGKVSQRDANNIKQYVEALLSANLSGGSYDRATSEWVNRIDEKLYGKLADAGLLEHRKTREDATLGTFTQRYIDTRATLKPKSVYMLTYCRAMLVDFLGADKSMAEVTEGDCDEYRQHLSGKGLTENTVRTACCRARQLFAAALRHKLIEVNPFSSMPNLRQVEERGRSRFVSREDVDKALAKLVDPEMRLIVALARYGGLRIPSEPLAMRWGDIDWARERITVQCIKTERHDGKATRVIPLFPEIKPHLDALWAEPREGTEYIILRHRLPNASLKRRLIAACKAAGVEPWPKTFHNLRSTRETELMEVFPPQTVCKWIGHDISVAAKNYLQVTDDHYARALQMCVQQPAATDGVRVGELKTR